MKLPSGPTTYRLEARGSRWIVLAERPTVTVPLRQFKTEVAALMFLDECRDRAAFLSRTLREATR